MAPLFSNLDNYAEAIACLKKVIESETEEILKVGLLTKIAGNYKKLNDETNCIQNSLAAYNIIKRLQGEKNVQSCICLINLAGVYQHFDQKDEALRLYEEFITLFDQENWTGNVKYEKLRDFAKAAIEEIKGGEEEFYDEEEEEDK